ncbi:lipid II:glycine glycyltransferase FemX [archaeon]
MTWNDFVKAHPNGNVFQTEEMAKVYKAAKGYKPIQASVKGEDGELAGVLLAHVVSEKVPLSSRAVIQGGPLAKSREVLAEVLEEYNTNALYTEVRNMHDVAKEKSVFELEGYEFEEHLNYVLPLKKKTDEIFDSMHKNKRWGVRKAGKEGVEVRKASGLNEWYSLLQKTYSRAKLPLADKSLFDAVAKIMPRNSRFTIAYRGETPLAAMACIYWNGVAYDWYMGIDREHSELCGGDLLVWEMIEWAAKSGLKSFDFMGGGKPGEEYGVRKFKKQFGGEETNYGRFRKMHKPRLYKAALKGFEVYRRVAL